MHFASGAVIVVGPSGMAGSLSSLQSVEHDADSRNILLYDGACVLCDHTVNFVLRNEAGARLRFAPLGGTTAAAIIERHPVLREVDSIVLVEGREAAERVFTRSDAAIRLSGYLAGKWKSAYWLRVLPRPLRDLGYRLVARYRYRIFGRRDACRLPSADVQHRFLP